MRRKDFVIIANGKEYWQTSFILKFPIFLSLLNLNKEKEIQFILHKQKQTHSLFGSEIPKKG